MSKECEKKLYLDGYEINVGDRLYSVLHGWGTVAGLLIGAEYEVRLTFGDLKLRTYTADGKYYRGQKRSLYWDEVKITPPPKPKKKEVRYQWLMLYCDSYYLTIRKYKDAAAAERMHNGDAVRPIEETAEEFEVSETVTGQKSCTCCKDNG